MGNCCTHEQKEQFEAVVEDVQEKAEQVAEQVQDAVQDVVQDAVQDAGGAAAEVVADVKEAVQDKVEDAAEVVADVVVDVKEDVTGAVDAVADTMTAAVAAVTGIMIVEFDAGKGGSKSVDFKSQELGFVPARTGGGCCASAAVAKVVVGNVDKNTQADKLGVKRSWVVKSVNGTAVTGLEEARKLLEEGRAKLPAEVAEA